MPVAAGPPRKRKVAGPGKPGTKRANKPATKLGRRPGRNATQDVILDAAEEMFAAHGYAATALREIAAKARVNQALLHHYFQSKEGLYRAIFLRRGGELAQERLQLLDLLEQRGGPAPTVEDLMRAYLVPAYNLKRRGAGGRAFMHLQARLHSEPEALTRDIRASVYDETMRRYMAALGRAASSLDPHTLYWRMVFVVGAYFYTISDHHRLADVSGGLCDPSDLDESFRQLVSFLTGGLGAPSLPARDSAVRDSSDPLLG
jgi:AcrR family transcriptional regulator